MGTFKTLQDLTGQVIGSVTVLELVQTKPTVWKVQCKCGHIFNAFAGNMRQAIKKRGSYSCVKCRAAQRKADYNLAEPEYGVWQKMKQRCLNPNDLSYGRYGGKGITVCDRWKNSYPNFLEDMGRRPDDSYSIDRIDPKGNYEPENCRWIPSYSQSANRSNNIKISINGVTKILKHWCEDLGVNYKVTHCRYKRDGKRGKALFPEVTFAETDVVEMLS